MTLQNALLWIHLLAAVGMFGGLVAVRWGLAPAARHQADVVQRAYRILSGMLLVALVAGLTLFVVQITGASETGGLPSATHMKIGIKFLLLLAVGGCVGLASAFSKKERSGPADNLAVVAILLLAVASALGVWI